MCDRKSSLLDKGIFILDEGRSHRTLLCVLTSALASTSTLRQSGLPRYAAAYDGVSSSLRVKKELILIQGVNVSGGRVIGVLDIRSTADSTKAPCYGGGIVEG